jgi:mannose-6-phosphate isomerase-like protein (cupin superfamily)
MEIVNLFREVQDAPLDPQTGIRITRITGNDAYSFYAAEIAPMTNLRPHYHEQGIELYQVISGTGIMRTGKRAAGNIIWDEEFSVIPGDCFTIAEGMVHQLANRSHEPLLAGFVCPTSHVGKDRFFIE